MVSTAVQRGYTIGGVVEAVTLTDPAVDSAVREALGITSADTLMTDMLWSLPSLTLPDTVRDLSDLAYMTGLRSPDHSKCLGAGLLGAQPAHGAHGGWISAAVPSPTGSLTRHRQPHQPHQAAAQPVCPHGYQRLLAPHPSHGASALGQFHYRGGRAVADAGFGDGWTLSNNPVTSHRRSQRLRKAQVGGHLQAASVTHHCPLWADKTPAGVTAGWRETTRSPISRPWPVAAPCRCWRCPTIVWRTFRCFLSFRR